mgnify:FL=1|tara:strand:- start:1861 stop:2538 length:678 start_codon:yes stop_codon:yes gene_type:complete
MFITYKNGKEYKLDYDEDAHSYKVDGVKVPSVTRIVDACFPKNLTEWAVSVGEEEYRRVTDEALNIGNKTHEWIEKYIKLWLFRGYQTPKTGDKFFNSVSSFLEWEEKFKPEWLYEERKVYCDKYNYAGTVDAVAKINGRICVIDFKTSKKIYKPYHLQVTAYAQAIKRIDRLRQWPLGIILRLDKETGEFQQKVFEPKDHFKTFIKCMELRQWSSLRIKEANIV